MSRLLLFCLLLASSVLAGVPYRSDRFSVEFPSQPTVSKDATSFRAQATGGKSIYMVIWVKNPQGAKLAPQKALDATLAAMIEQAGIKLQSKKAVKVGKAPGYDFTGNLKGAPCWGRLSIVKDRAYLQLVAGGQPGPAVDRFYKSFKLL